MDLLNDKLSSGYDNLEALNMNLLEHGYNP